MKALILFLGLLSAFQALALDRQAAERMLQQKQISLRQIEQGGGKLLLGEVTGAGLVLPADRVQAILLADRAILRRELEGMEFNPSTGRLGDLDSFRAGGVYFTREDIRGVVVR